MKNHGDRLKLDPEELYRKKQEALNALRIATELISFDTMVAALQEPEEILEETAKKIQEIYKFKGVCFYLVNEENGFFYQARCIPDKDSVRFEEECAELIESGVFSLALHKNAPHFTQAINEKEFILIHPITTPRRIRGMFLAISPVGKDKFPEHVGYLLTLILFFCANLLESYETYGYLKDINTKLEEHVEALGKLNTRLIKEIETRKQKEIELKKSEERYRSIIENIEDAYVEMDLNGKLTFCNNSLLKITGYDKSEVIGKKFSSFVDKKDRSMVLKLIKGLLKGKMSNRYIQIKINIKDGGSIFMEGLLSPIKDGDENLVGFRTILRDVTNRKSLGK